MQQQLFTFLTLADTIFLTIYCHSLGCDRTRVMLQWSYHMMHIQSPQGDNATALAEFALSEHSQV